MGDEMLKELPDDSYTEPAFTHRNDKDLFQVSLRFHIGQGKSLPLS